MSIEIIPVPPFADVPDALGVPVMLRSPLFPTPEPSPVNGDGSGGDASNLGPFGSGGSTPQPQWGIFDQGGAPVITSDTVVGFDFKRDYRLIDYPVEQGAFASYNKVQMPYEPRFTMAKGGSQADRTSFITAIEGVIGDFNLYNIVTPEFTWTNANFDHWDTQRTYEKGVSLITAEIWLREIRVAPAAAFSQTQTAAGQSPQSVGTVQAQPATPAQAALAQPATVPGPNGT